MSDEQTFLPLSAVIPKMKITAKQNSSTYKPAHQCNHFNCSHQFRSVSAWKLYPEIMALGHQWGEWNYEGGRKAAEAALAVRQDYEGSGSKRFSNHWSSGPP